MSKEKREEPTKALVGRVSVDLYCEFLAERTRRGERSNDAMTEAIELYIAAGKEVDFNGNAE